MMRHARRIAAVLALVLFAALAAPFSALAATLTASTDRSTLAQGETVSLTLSLTGGDSTQPPDLSALSKDFEILDRRRGSRMVTVDGKRIQVNEWFVLLSPRRIGTLTIAPLSVAGQTSAPLSVHVVAGSALDPNEDRPLFVQTDVGDTSAYVQGEIPVSIRIYDNVGILGLGFTRPEAQGASFAPRGETQSYWRTIGSRRYRVFQQDYVMTPQRAGTLEIQPVTVVVMVPSSKTITADAEMARLLGRTPNPQSWLDAGAQGREIKLHSDPVQVEVKSRPTQATGWFLPARSVTLTNQWSAAPGQTKVGDTLTRTIRLTAIGATANQLPPLTLPPVEGLRQYEEDNRPESILVKGETAAELTLVSSVVPAQPGTFTLPAVQVDWWNTRTNRQETAVLPAQTLTVAPAASTAASPVAFTPPAPASAEAASDAGPDVDVMLPWLLPKLEMLQEHLPLTGALALALMGLGAGAAVLGRRSRAVRAPAAPTAPEQSVASALAALKQAARRGEPRATHGAYLAFIRVAVAPEAKELEQAATALARALYRDCGEGWNPKGFAAAVRAEERARRKRRRPSGRLVTLYPVKG